MTVASWITLGVVVLGVLLLLGVLLTLVPRLRRLARMGLALRALVGEAEALQADLVPLQARVAETQGRAEHVRTLRAGR